MKRNSNSFNTLFQLTKRNLIVYLKNKVRMCFTLMVPVLVFLLYIFFLRSLESGIMLGELKNIPELWNGSELKYSSMQNELLTMMDLWMMGGISGISALTISIQSNSLIVEDKENGINRDLMASPVDRKVLIGSYFLFNFLITFLLCFIFLIILFVYLIIMREFAFNFIDILLIIGVLIITCIVSTLLTICICVKINRGQTLASLVAVFSSVIGFLMGAYIPLGIFPNWLQGICCFLPGTHAVALSRYSFMASYVNNFQNKYPELSADTKNKMTDVLNKFGYNLNFFGQTITPTVELIVLVCSIILFGFLSLILSRSVYSMGKPRRDKNK